MIRCTFENNNKASLRHAVVDNIVIDGNKILLVKRAPHLLNGNKWALPGGYIERNETSEQAASRELKEETGLIAKRIKFFKIIDNPNRKNEDRQNITFIHVIKAAGKIKIQEEEVSQAKWFDLNKMPQEKDFAFDHFDTIKSYIDAKNR